MSKILLIDDDAPFSATLQRWLTLKGYDVVVASNGRLGLEMVETEKPDLIITDVVMPELDGIELIMSLKKSSQTSNCKIIAISGGGRLSGEFYLDMVKDLDIAYSMEKPLDLPVLEAKLGELLE